MTCRDAANLLPLFFDGELDARQMRAVALHGTRCNVCETELRQMERLQEIVGDSINAAVEEIDLSAFWSSIEPQLGTVRLSWWERARARWREGEHRWVVRAPAFAVAAIVAVLALFLLTRLPPSSQQPAASQIAALDHAAAIDTLDSESDAVTVINDPDTGTTVLWVSDETDEALK